MGATAMIGRADRNMQVTSGELEQREEPTRRKTKDPAEEPSELEALRARIAAAKTLTAAPHEVHCRDCFEKGRDAALLAIEGPAKP